MTELSSTGLLPDGSQQSDTAGRPITPRRRRWGMKVNVLCCGLGTLFATIFWPGSPLFILYLQERLGATLTQVGFFAAIAGIGQIVQLLGVFIFDRTRTRKRLWVTLVLIYRCLGFVTVGFAIYAYHWRTVHGAAVPGAYVWALMLSLAVGFSVAQLTATAWWSWMADLAPQSIRGRFFANRQLASTVATLIGILPVVLLDTYGKDAAGNYTDFADYIFIGIIFVCTLSGIIDIIIHGFIPEPKRDDRPDAPTRWRDLATPFHRPDFRRLIVTMTLLSLSAGLSVHFIWPYLKSEQYINAPYRVFLAARLLFALCVLIGSRYWGMLIDRVGSKPVMAVTYAAGFINLYVLFVTRGNVWWLAPAAGAMQGLMFSGMMLAGSQLMLSLAPQKNRNVHVGVYAAVVGVGMVLGPWMGGLIGDGIRPLFSNLDYRLPWGTVLTHIQVMVGVSLLCRLALYPLLLRIREGREKPVGVVLGTVFGASQFRTMNAMRLFGGRNVGKRLDAMRRMGASSDHLAVDDLIGQLADAEPEIRREATLALGRIGGPEAVQALVDLLTAPESDVQPEAARALGMTGDRQAVAPLMDKLIDPNEIIREHAAGALGELQSPEAAERLMEILKHDPSPAVSGRGALALAKLGVMDAIWEILPRMHQTDNRVLRRQLATAVGNLLGDPGRFYHLMNEELRSPGSQVVGLVKQTQRRFRQWAKRMGSDRGEAEGRRLAGPAEHLDRAVEAVDLQAYDQAIEHLHGAAMDLLHDLYGFTGDDEVAVEYALSRRGRFGVGLWFLQVAMQYARSRDSRDELLRLDALLGFHFIRDFAETRRR